MCIVLELTIIIFAVWGNLFWTETFHRGENVRWKHCESARRNVLFERSGCFPHPFRQDPRRMSLLPQSNCHMPQSGPTNAGYFGSAAMEPGQRHFLKPCAAKGYPKVSWCFPLCCLLRRSFRPRLGHWRGNTTEQIKNQNFQNQSRSGFR